MVLELGITLRMDVVGMRMVHVTAVVWCACSLSLSEDDIEEHAKDGKQNARPRQSGVADEENLVDFLVHFFWGAIRGNTV